MVSLVLDKVVGPGSVRMGLVEVRKGWAELGSYRKFKVKGTRFEDGKRKGMNNLGP